jgi:hypothetical protein
MGISRWTRRARQPPRSPKMVQHEVGALDAEPVKDGTEVAGVPVDGVGKAVGPVAPPKPGKSRRDRALEGTGSRHKPPPVLGGTGVGVHDYDRLGGVAGSGHAGMGC